MNVGELAATRELGCYPQGVGGAGQSNPRIHVLQTPERGLEGEKWPEWLKKGSVRRDQLE